MSAPKKALTILQILPKLESGGVERGVVDISKAMIKSGLTPIVISSGGSMIRQLKEQHIKHINLPVNSKNPLTIYKNISAIANIIKENSVDIVHVRSRAPAWSAHYACLRTNCKMITTFHGSYSSSLFGKKKSSLKMKYNAIMLRASAVIAVSNFSKHYIKDNYTEEAEKIPGHNLVVIHRGVDLEQFSVSTVSQSRLAALAIGWNLPDDKKIIMLPARITGWKGHEFLIDSLAKVKNDNFFCIMVGSDKNHIQYRKKLEKIIEKKGLDGKIRFVGDTKDITAAYVISDLVISASTKPEAFGRIAIEAGAMNKIVIATNIGGSLETIIDGTTGFLVESENTDDMAAKIDVVLSMDQNKKEEMGRNAREHISKNFSNQKMYDSTINLYKKIIKN
jgi:glycosyltransferase involved in cell wall biosynthesis